MTNGQTLWRGGWRCIWGAWGLTVAMFCCSSLRAWTSCPCPMETYRVSIFSLFPRAMMESVGSEPIDRKQMRGVCGSDSSHVFSKSRITPSEYFSPIASLMYLRAWRSGEGETLRHKEERFVQQKAEVDGRVCRVCNTFKDLL